MVLVNADQDPILRLISKNLETARKSRSPSFDYNVYRKSLLTDEMEKRSRIPTNWDFELVKKQSLVMRRVYSA